MFVLESTPIKPIESVLSATGKMPVPQHYCNTCLRLRTDNRCECFQRPVQPTENKCFNHTYYAPVTKVFKPLTDTQLFYMSA